MKLESHRPLGNMASSRCPFLSGSTEHSAPFSQAMFCRTVALKLSHAPESPRMFLELPLTWLGSPPTVSDSGDLGWGSKNLHF